MTWAFSYPGPLTHSGGLLAPLGTQTLSVMYVYIGVSQNLGYHFRGPHIKDYSILGSILGSPYLGKLPYFLANQMAVKMDNYMKSAV